VATAEFLETQPPGRISLLEPYAQEVYDGYISLSSFGSSDAEYLQGLRQSLLPNLNAAHHLPGVENYDPLIVGLYHDLLDLLTGEGNAPLSLDKARSVLELLGARYLITNSGGSLLTDDELDLPLLYSKGPHIYANEGALPAAWIVPQARVVENRQARLAILLDPGFDPRSEVILSRAPASPLVTVIQSPGQAPPTVLREGPNQVRIELDLRQPGVLVLADTYYPGWQATVDGAPAEILPANHAFRAIPLDSGEHQVVFDYAPLSFRLGAWITAGAALAFVAAMGAAMIRISRGRARKHGANNQGWRS
jgi:hypothetical protein